MKVPKRSVYRRRSSALAAAGLVIIIAAVVAANRNGNTNLGVSSSGPSTTLSTTPSGNSTGAEQTFAVGQTGHITETGKVVLTLTVTNATATTSPASDGTSPANGYFATFTMTATDVSQNQTYDFSPADFYVQTSDGRQFTFTSGNSVHAAVEQPNNLDSIQVMNPGQVLTGTITIDEPAQHASLVYAPNLQALVAWTF